MKKNNLEQPIVIRQEMLCETVIYKKLCLYEFFHAHFEPEFDWMICHNICKRMVLLQYVLF